MGNMGIATRANRESRASPRSVVSGAQPTPSATSSSVWIRTWNISAAGRCCAIFRSFYARCKLWCIETPIEQEPPRWLVEPRRAFVSARSDQPPAKHQTNDADRDHHDIEVAPGVAARHRETGRAHVCTPVTNAHLVCLLLFEKT